MRHELAAITDIIVNTVPTERVYLFGSYAYGTPKQDSDYDLYVVLRDDTPYRAIEATHKIRRAMREKQPRSIDLLTAKKARFVAQLSAPTLEQEIVEKGVRLFG